VELAANFTRVLRLWGGNYENGQGLASLDSKPLDSRLDRLALEFRFVVEFVVEVSSLSFVVEFRR